MEQNGFTRMLKNLGGIISKNSPTILTGLSVGGLLTTAIFASRATVKAVRIIDEEMNYRMESAVYSTSEVPPLSLKETIKLTWKEYIPAACFGAVTIACIIGSNSISQRRNAALATVYGLTETAFREYKEKVVETIGKNKELKVRDDISSDHIKRNPVSTNEVIITGKGNVLCYDTLSGRYFKSDIERIRRSISDLRIRMVNEMFVTVNDWYEELGLTAIDLGNQMGWDIDKEAFDITFSSQLSEENEPCLVLEYKVEPRHIR